MNNNTRFYTSLSKKVKKSTKVVRIEEENFYVF